MLGIKINPPHLNDHQKRFGKKRSTSTKEPKFLGTFTICAASEDSAHQKKWQLGANVDRKYSCQYQDGCWAIHNLNVIQFEGQTHYTNIQIN